MVFEPQYSQTPNEELLEAGEYGSPSHNASASATTYSYRRSHISPLRQASTWDQSSELPPPVSTRQRRWNVLNTRERRLNPDQELALLVLFASCAAASVIFFIALSYT
ncbi:hypothetical protein BJY00DRAFT_306944 [Aspergillus carlsbadensis]|nr:hypothetical protein BJY00DRAFT_306944 [Aspergillus carlsbadensis]